MSEHSKIVSLGDVVIERSERVDDPSSTGISRFIGLEHFDSGRLSINRFGTTDDLESAMKICRARDTLLARRNVYLKRASMTEFDAICSGDAIVLHETPDLVPGFLPIILNSTDFWDYANENADGSMSKRLSVKHLKGYQFHLPSKDEQLRVVNLVWKLERLDSSLSSMLSDLDLCIKSRFIEMFSPYLNDESYRFDLKSISLVGPQNGIYKKDEGHPHNTNIVKMGQMFDGESIRSSQKFETIELTDDEKSKYLLHSEDILFGRRSLVVAGAGKCSWVDNLTADTTFESSIIRFTPNKDIARGRYIYNWFQTAEGIQSIVKIRNVVTIAGVKGSDLAKIRIPVPPLDLQNDFVQFSEQVDKSKFMLKKHIEDTKSLQQAIINKCFEANDDV